MQESADYHQPPAPVKHHLPGIARCLVLGVIGKSGVAVRYSTTGSPCASFTLVVREQGQDGKVHELWVPCEVWGKRAEGVTALEAGQLCLFDGKLAKRKKGEQWEFVVSGWDVQVLGAPMAALPGRN